LHQNSEYRGVLQSDLAKILKDTRDCKKDISNKLIDKLIPTRRPGENSIINYGVSGDLAVNVVPDIRCKLAYPWKLEKERVRKQIDNPEITITNAGPIKAVAFSVDLKSYLFDKPLGVIESEVESRMETHGHFIFEKEVQPADEIKEQVNGYLYQNKIAIYIFSLKYYREADMQVFNRQDMFLMDNYEILPEKDYTTNTNYSRCHPGDQIL
jgi:hypothetical protein